MSFLKTGIAGGGKSEGLTYVDVGGNIGSCSLMMAGTVLESLQKDLKVLTFIPFPKKIFL